MHRRLLIAVITLMLSIGTNFAAAADFLPCVDESSPTTAAVTTDKGPDHHAILPQSPTQPLRPVTGSGHCPVASPFSAALAPAVSGWTACAFDRSRYGLSDDDALAALCRPPLLGPPRPVSRNSRA